MEAVGGIPLECLTPGELAGVWSGWTTMGDREVVREASTKGHHINLAYKFLAYRRHWTEAEAQRYFHSEVEAWIGELLGKKQVHRASHILQKIGKDPLVYISEICTRCREPELRDYLANHVLNNNGFSQEQIDAWEIIKCIKKNEEIQLSKHLLNCPSAEKISIEEILNLSSDIKNPLLTELYFFTYEPCLSRELENSAVWDYLLAGHKIELLIQWIDVTFGDQDVVISEEEKEGHKLDVIELFKRLKIMPEMIERIKQSHMCFPFKEILLNHLCKYGVFVNVEGNDMKSTVMRFLGADIIPEDVYEILCKSSCNLDKHEFSRKRHSILFYQHQENSDDNLHCQDAELLRSFQKLDSLENNVANLITTICQGIHRITNTAEEFLKNEPLVTLYLILLHYLTREVKELSEDDETEMFHDFLTMPTEITAAKMDISSDILTELLFKIPYLNCCVEKKKRNDITVYQVLDGYRNLSTEQLFRWRVEKKEMPHFGNAELIKNYGHREKLTYKYYLKEACPSMAAYILLNPDGKQALLSSKMKSKNAFQSHTLALKNLKNPEIVCSCICFIGFLGVDSERLRIHATAADHVHIKLQTAIHDLLKSVVCQNSKDLASLLNHLEENFTIEFSTVSMDNIAEFVRGLQSWDFVLRFARAHNASLPASFLKMLARSDRWFEFSLVGNIFCYPVEQMLEIMAFFKNSIIHEHFGIFLSSTYRTLHNFPQSQKTRPSKQKQRKYTSVSSIPPTVCMELPPEPSLTKDKCFLGNHKNSSFNHDLWMAILKCHQSQDPPGALLNTAKEMASSVMVVLAACYEPSSRAAYCYSWLVISVNNQDLINDYSDCLNDQVWPVRKVSELFRKLTSLRYIDTLFKGLEIFLPENPLYLFFKFLVQCGKFCEFEKSQRTLVDFINTLSTLKINKTIEWNDTDMTYLSNEYWIAMVCMECIIAALKCNFLSTQQQRKFLNLLVDSDLNEELHIIQPDFQSLLNIIMILSRTSVKINFDQIKLAGEEFTVTQEVERCIRQLMEAENFSIALELSKTAHLPCSNIILDQYRKEFTKNLQEDVNELNLAFWNKCAYDIKKYNVGFEDAVSFFIESAERVKSYKERYEILELALETLKPISTDQQIMDTVEMAMWKACILAGVGTIEILKKRKHFNKLKSALLSDINKLSVSCVLDDESEEKALEALINRFLDIDDVETAMRIAAIFNYKHKDLQILVLCLSLAEGEVSPHQLSSQYRSLISDNATKENTNQKTFTLTNRGLQKRLCSSSVNLSSPNSTSNSDGNDSPSIIHDLQTDCILLLEKLIKNLEHGLNIVKKILVLYKLSTHLKTSYVTLLLLRNPMEIMYEITSSHHSDKFALMAEIISTYRIKNTEVTKFLAAELVLHLTKQVEENLDTAMLMWGYPLDVTFSLSTVLCDDPSLLGWELLKGAMMRLGKSLGAHRDISILKLTVELLIKAHHCFTMSCSMEGIASVLRKCQQFSNTLQVLKLWSLLVRLVTGVGRFTEMNYILQILKENDQFEFLLGIGTDKVSGLEIALLEFCKKQYPEDKELFTLISHHFRLYNEIAVMWENESKSIIRELIKETRRENIRPLMMNQSVRFTRNDNTERKLQCAMTNYTHATEYYLRDNKLNLAKHCCLQTQLVALQISLLNGVTPGQQVACLLSLSSEEINKTICHALSFPQALIVVQSYNHIADWSSAIYHHVIINADTKYLKDFLASKRLTSAVVQDCVYRYRSEKVITKQMTLNLQTLICKLNEIEVKYVLASQLGFKELIEGLLLNDTTGSYLKDTVWKQGFNAQGYVGETFYG